MDYIEVTVDDIAVANRLAHEVLGRTLDELPPQTRRLLEILERRVAERQAELAVERSDTYDPFGNLQSIGGTSGRSTPTSSSTNRLTGAGTVYDSGGNLLGNGALSFYNNQPSGSAHLVVDVTGYFTEGGGSVVAYHAYYPFGEEATAFNQDTEQMKFTGHERDLASSAGAGDDLDYMHARHCSPLTGQFLNVDPAIESADPFTPQTWNRYNNVAGNPLKYIDPTGEMLFFLGLQDMSNKWSPWPTTLFTVWTW